MKRIKQIIKALGRFIGITAACMVITGSAFGQVINTVGYVRTASAPVHTPSAQGATVAIDTLSGDWYEWDRAANTWRAMGFRVQQTNTGGIPNYTPSKQRSRFAINAGDSLFFYQAGTWGLLNPIYDLSIYATNQALADTSAAIRASKVSSVTGPSVNNSDPLNPIVEIPANLTFYSTTTASDVPGYLQLVIDINDVAYNDPAVNVPTGSISGLAQPVGVLISPAGTFAGNPGVISISTVGEIRRVSGTGLAEFYYEVYQRDSNGVEVLVATSNATAPVAQSVYTQFSAEALLLNGNWLPSDRVVIRYYANRLSGGSNPSYEFLFGGTNPVRTLFPISASLLLNVPISVGVTGVTGGVPGSVLTVDALGKLGQEPFPIDTVSLLLQDSILVYTVAGQEVGRDTIRVQAGGAGTVKGVGVTNYLARWAGVDSLSIGVTQDNGTGVGIGTAPQANVRAVVRGTGTTSANTALRVENSTGTAALLTNDAQSTGLNTTPTEAILTTKAKQEPVRVLAVVPTQTFDNNTNWAEGAGWLITGGVATATATTGALTYTGALTITPGNAYEVVYTLSGYSAGTAQIRVGNAFYTVGQFNHTTTVVIVPTSATGGFRITGSPAFTGNFDNITVNEITLPATIQMAGQLSTSATLYGGVVIPNASSQFVGGGGRFATGANNISFGSLALRSNTTGFGNTAFAANALQNNTTGFGNTAIGAASLQNNTTGSSNTAFAANSLLNNTTGSSNTAIGANALQNNTTGNNNTAIGIQAIQANISGSDNVAVGYFSQQNTTGSSNTSNGFRSLVSNTTGSFNIASGRDAGRFIANGFTANTITNNSIYIGFDTRALADNQTNQIVIGHTAIGKGSNTATIGNSSVTVLWLAGEVGWFQGSGSPEGVVTAPEGSFYSNKAGGAGTTFWVKESGTSNVGWISK